MSGGLRRVGHRVLRGANLYADEPLWVLFVRGDVDAQAVRQRIQAAGLDVDGANAGELIGSIATNLQADHGLEQPWYEATLDADGDWFIVHNYAHEHAGEAAGRAALDLVAAAGAGEPVDVAAARDAVAAAFDDHARTPSVAALLEAAEARGIPVMRRGDQHYQLGWGIAQEHLWGTMTGRVSGLGFDIANDHERVMQMLEDTGIPCPRGDSRRSLAGCQELAEELRYPLTAKPLRGRGGVTVRIDGPDQLEAAYDKAKQFHRWVVLQDFVSGAPHRVLVVAGNVVGAVRRTDGADVTDSMHPAVALACQRAARLCGLEIVGVDVVADNLEVPLDETRGAVVSLHPAPSLEPFLERGAAEAVLETLVPEGDGRIPLVAVTGTNGKTTTVRLASHILKYAGGRVGMACTGAVEVENHVILRGDYSGPSAARTVLREPGVTHAVCEVARGGILRRGLGFDACDVAIFLNVASDHLGEGGIETIDDLARLKGVVVRAVKPGGAAVLNADDAMVWAQRHELKCAVIPFTMDADHPDLQRHLAAGPDRLAVTFQDAAIVVRRGRSRYRLMDIVDIPITLEGAAMFNVQNAMAATAAALALGVPDEDIRAGLQTFNPTPNQLPGRMNLIRLGGVKVLLDYGHNVPALQALGEVLPRLAHGRKLNVANAAGNRRDEDLREFGQTLAGIYDRIYVCDPDKRRRQEGETAGIIVEGILSTGFAEEQVILELDEARALRMALAESRPGDLVVLQADDVGAAIKLCQELQRRLEAGESPADLNQKLLA